MLPTLRIALLSTITWVAHAQSAPHPGHKALAALFSRADFDADGKLSLVEFEAASSLFSGPSAITQRQPMAPPPSPVGSVSPAVSGNRPSSIHCSPGCGIKVMINGRLTKCGFRTGRDCPRPFTTEELLRSSSEYDPSNSTHAAALAARKLEAESFCNPGLEKKFKTLSSGGWCGNKGHGHFLHKELTQNILKLLSRRNTSMPDSIMDLGAGTGHYGKYLLKLDPRVDYRGYDGMGDVEKVAGSTASFADMTMPLSLPPSDWVLSLEAGEHVPRMHEMIFMRNLHVHNCKGIILSWAALSQGGFGHVNVHSAMYLRAVFSDLGYIVDTRLTQLLQNDTEESATLTVLRKPRHLAGAHCAERHAASSSHHRMHAKGGGKGLSMRRS